MTNFNIRLKNIFLKDILHRMCINPSKKRFNILYDDLIKISNLVLYEKLKNPLTSIKYVFMVNDNCFNNYVHTSSHVSIY
ncbi:hypothetical protein SADUNF_Sadunf16G0254600 [Salix dunnii]|uniref:Uncharacterized protein n=1 Tax=Salix dunnii TaxID=1413687 RepID=A0A835JC51_9ROSI|nr:hypothetical protein SADUNF_Sadunf16G0254600 [Salix dunnii]